MSKKIVGPEIEKLIQLLARIPGLGPRSARKAALSLLKKRQELLVPLSDALNAAISKIMQCPVCGNLDTISPCTICEDPKRDQNMIVVVEEVSDLWALERAGALNARYHVLGGHLSPLDGVGPEKLNINNLIERACHPEVTEILLALNATVEGQSTSHYLMDKL
ncbi:MAG: recombination mediator RecR, partial [Hyphomicrobium sp.]